MRLNRRVPNGTHGGVGGRSLNEWVTSYPIVRNIFIIIICKFRYRNILLTISRVLSKLLQKRRR